MHTLQVRPRKNGHGCRRRVDLLDTSHPIERQANVVFSRNCPARKASHAALGHNGLIPMVANLEYCRNFVRGMRENHSQRPTLPDS